MFLSSRILVFSDFNCPFCFTLNEWLNDLGFGQRVKWVGIEHKPDLPRQGKNNAEDLATKTGEVREVQRRAPEVAVVAPPLWAHSGLALGAQCAVEDDFPHQAAALRTTLFRRLWRDGSNIANPRLVDECLKQNGLPPVADLFIDQQRIEEQTLWWKAELDRIPCMIAPTGVRHLGLQDKEKVSAFLSSALHELPPGRGCQ